MSVVLVDMDGVLADWGSGYGSPTNTRITTTDSDTPKKLLRSS